MASKLFSFGKYMVKVAAELKEHPCLRQGQASYNVLHEVYPELAKEINGTDLDPFYNEDKLEAFYNWLGEK